MQQLCLTCFVRQALHKNHVVSSCDAKKMQKNKEQRKSSGVMSALPCHEDLGLTSLGCLHRVVLLPSAI